MANRSPKRHSGRTERGGLAAALLALLAVALAPALHDHALPIPKDSAAGTALICALCTVFASAEAQAGLTVRPAPAPPAAVLAPPPAVPADDAARPPGDARGPPASRA